MMDNKVEQVARAIAANFYDPSDWNSKFCLDCARAAIAAHEAALKEAGYVIVPREPTEAMRVEGSCFGGFDGEWQRDNTIAIWRAMIDAALLEKDNG